MSSSASAEARSEAELRVITVKTEAGDPVIYSGNPAELPGVRFEMQKAMKRAGAFSLLVKHNASRLKNGIIATEDLNSIPIVTQVIPDDVVGRRGAHIGDDQARGVYTGDNQGREAQLGDNPRK